MSLQKTLCSLYLLTWLVQWAVFWLIKRYLYPIGYAHAHVSHFEHIVRIELFMVLGSIFIWKRTGQLLIGGGDREIEDDGGRKKFSPATFDRKKSRSDPKLISTTTTRRNKIRSAVFILFGSLFIFFTHLSQFLNYFANSVEPRLISLVCLSCFGIWIHLVAFMIGFGVVNFFVRLVTASSKNQKSSSSSNSNSSSRWFVYLLKQLLTNVKWQTCAALTLAGVFSAALLISAAGYPRVKRVQIQLSRLPRSLDGFTIALLTDLHAGPTVGRRAFEHAVRMTNQLQADIVTIVGDLVDGDIGALRPVVEPIGDLKAKYGVYYTTGNHELYYGRVDDWIAYLNSLNVKVLINENVKISPPVSQENRQKQEPSSSSSASSSLCLAGADDIYAEGTGIIGHAMDLRAAVNGCSADGPIILMAHNPRAAKMALELERKVDLILCGHTHAGQMYVLAPLMYAMMPFFHGLYNYEQTGTQIYVSAGVFYMGAPMKMFAMEEIILLTLKSSS